MITGHLLGRMGVWLQADQVILLFMVEAVVLLTPHDVLSVHIVPGGIKFSFCVPNLFDFSFHLV